MYNVFRDDGSGNVVRSWAKKKFNGIMDMMVEKLHAS
jgi:hypothetical protein